MKKTQRGFALLIAVIFMSVMLTFGLALGSLGYKQQVLASTAVASQYAFYAADSALECALYADEQLNLFAYANYNPDADPNVNCDGTAYPFATLSHTATVWITKARMSLDSDTRCADVTIYKYSAPQPLLNNVSTYLFSQGFDVPCATVAGSSGARFVSRGLNARY